jgi:hypothetical protein
MWSLLLQVVRRRHLYGCSIIQIPLYIIILNLDSQDSIYWEDKDDIERLASILKFIPDESPCDLAVICRKRCREVCRGYRLPIAPNLHLRKYRYLHTAADCFPMTTFEPKHTTTLHSRSSHPDSASFSYHLPITRFSEIGLSNSRHS